ncbi:hypothetical protein GCM10020331_043030 [Ectobacillus funiculus]
MTMISLVVIGMICGILPMIVGVLQEKAGSRNAWTFFLSVVSAIIYGWYLAIPIAITFTLLLVKPKTWYSGGGHSIS